MKKPLKLVKKGGKWLVVVPDLPPEEVFKDFIRAMAEAIGAGATK